MKEIAITKGYVAVVDDCDYEMLSPYKWKADVRPHTVYVCRTAKVGGRWTTVFMHRIILGLTDRTVDIDHIDHDGLNNRRVNLRPCTRSQNSMNRLRNKTSSSGIKGVSWVGRQKAWQARIKLNGKSTHLGYFPTKEAAGEAYVMAAKLRHAEFAYIPQRGSK